ncbi:hypothetical protein [Arsenicicoccus dermatophilus]|uniref:hypothetical protein n=1 Tax=Arsenicicoccus dermatophilus TaxID=1076331 RepID=UPI001F4CA221|nr:hypothetical protein [Arsenicicoccus dermatophilus]MCH8614146.1 hypothetical protein [Arsenicicoccus dermatophilus]
MNTNALRALVLVGAATVGLSACGSAAATSAPATAITSTQGAAPVAAAPAARGQERPVAEAFAAQPASATRSGTKAAATRWADGKAGGQVKGATGDLKALLLKQLRTINAGDGCDVDAIVDKRIGGYARGQYWAAGCGGAAAIWAKGKSGWVEVFAGQEAPACSVIASKAPMLPEALGVGCVNEAGKAVTYRPGI